ncbi:MAG: energy transducer TonB [Spirochaetota bacterium]
MKIGDENIRLIIGFGISVIFHFVLFFPFAGGNSIAGRIFSIERPQKTADDKEETVLLSTDAPKEMIPDKRTPFVSDRNTMSTGKRTKSTGYNIYARDNTKVFLSPHDRDQEARPDLIVETLRGEKGTEPRGEKVEKKDPGDITVGKQKGDTAAVLVEPGQEEMHARRMPFVYDENEEIKVGFSLDDGKLVLGSRMMPYAGYCIEFVNSVRESFFKSLSLAAIMNLRKTDEVEILFSIDGSGKIEFVSVSKPSLRQQENFQIQCIQAVMYAAPVSPPPYELMRDEGREGKLYIPFTFKIKEIQ